MPSASYIVALSLFEREVDLHTSYHEEIGIPFEALVQSCREACNIQDWEACSILATESFSCSIWRMGTGGHPPSKVKWAEIEVPWDRIRVRRKRMAALADALAVAEKLDVLSSVAGTNMGAIDLEPVRLELLQLQGEVDKISNDWDRRMAKPVESDRQQRSVQLDPPEPEQHAKSS